MSVCGVDASGVADGSAVWRRPGAARHVDESVSTDSPTWSVYQPAADGPQ